MSLSSPHKNYENLSLSLVFKSIKAVSNFLLEIRGLVRGISIFSTDELVVHESSELNLRSCRRCLACFFQGMMSIWADVLHCPTACYYV